MSDKLSEQQLARLIRDVEARAETCAVRVSLAMADVDDVVSETSLGAVRDDPEWCARTCETIRDHAEGCGRGAWRYAVRVVDGDRVVASTWARIVVRQSADDETSLDGSVGSYVQQLQRSLEASTKTNVELQRLMMANFEAQSKLIAGMFERQTALEKERAELVAEQLEQAAKLHVMETSKPDEVTQQLINMIAPALIQEVAPNLVPMLAQALGVGAPAKKVVVEATVPVRTGEGTVSDG